MLEMGQGMILAIFLLDVESRSESDPKKNGRMAEITKRHKLGLGWGGGGGGVAPSARRTNGRMQVAGVRAPEPENLLGSTGCRRSRSQYTYIYAYIHTYIPTYMHTHIHI